MSVPETAAHLGASRGTIYKWLVRKRIPAHKVRSLWKFRPSEVATYARARKAARFHPGLSQHLAPQGTVDCVFAIRSMSSSQSICNARNARKELAPSSQGLGNPRDIHLPLIEADLVVCMVALPGQIFYSTQIPVIRQFLAVNKNSSAKRTELAGKQHAHSATKPRSETAAICPVAECRSDSPSVGS